jgi:type IV pilus assembly protein PilB
MTEIVELLLKEGLITPDALEKAKEETKRTGLSIEKALEKLGFISEEDIVKARASSLGIPYMDLADYFIAADLVKLIPENIARKYKVVPLFKIGDTLSVGMSDPNDIIALDQVHKISNLDSVDPILVSEKSIQKVIDSYYIATESVEAIVKSLQNEKAAGGEGYSAAETAEEAPVIKLVNLLIIQAVKDRASDIHLEPEENALRVRYRIDGLLHEINILPKKLQNKVISRIKVLAAMDIAESRKPQDGRIKIKTENKDLDIRVSTFPTVHGENIVMRLLDKSSVLIGLKDLGLLEDDLAAFVKLIHRPNGIILVTGPTGSGKTTTLYAALTTVSSMEKNIITIEDPVEYEIPLIRQTQVNPKADMTFANGLRSILRQDPDIIMVGEIRDKETADIAIQAALTGHLVFSTLHTNDASSAITRLIDMGVEPFLVSSAIIGILAQRLVRLTCDKCKEKYAATDDVLKNLGLKDGTSVYRGKGCPKCKGSGFLGRLGIFELMVVHEDIRKMIEARKSADEIKKKAIELKMKTLRQDGLLKVQSGQVAAEEVLRVTEIEE